MAAEATGLGTADVRADVPKIETEAKDHKIRHTAKTVDAIKIDDTAK